MTNIRNSTLNPLSTRTHSRHHHCTYTTLHKRLNAAIIRKVPEFAPWDFCDYSRTVHFLIWCKCRIYSGFAPNGMLKPWRLLAITAISHRKVSLLDRYNLRLHFGEFIMNFLNV